MFESHIDIILCTFNGEKYLKSQIFSIIAQTHKCWTLHVFDDMSADSTFDILEDISRVDSRILIKRNDRQLGVALNFIQGLETVKPAGFFALSDQDDVWLENKLENLLAHIGKQPGLYKHPILVYSNSYYYKGNSIFGNVIACHPCDLNSFLMLNSGIQGCAMLGNGLLAKQLLKMSSDICMHDHYISLVALVFGKVSYCHDKLMLYRRHDRNVTVLSASSFFVSIFKHVTNKKALIDLSHYLTVASFCERNIIPADKRDILEAYLSLPKEPIVVRIFKIFKYRLNVNGNVLYIIFCALIKKPISSGLSLKINYFGGGNQSIDGSDTYNGDYKHRESSANQNQSKDC